MDLPQPPADQDLRNIIDKLAQFVARNGPEFEHMTKTKQKDNPKFSFLFGGEFYHYYTYKVKISDDSGIFLSFLELVSIFLPIKAQLYENVIGNEFQK